MSKCTAAQAVEAMQYWVGYYEKASSTYASRRDKAAFELDKGANNYTYAGYICGINGPNAAWCAMQDSLGIYEACKNSKADAKTVMHGVWPYTACNQLYDAAPSNMKGRRGSWTPIPGDIIVFSSNGSTREHTGMVEKVDSTYVYTIEGNKGNMCKRCQYKLTDSYIYGYVRPQYADATAGTTQTTLASAKACTITTYTLKEGLTGEAVKTLQAALNARGFNCGNVDGEFGSKTTQGVKLFQAHNNLSADGICGPATWGKLLGM